MLCIFTVVTPRRYARVAEGHVVVVLLATFVIFVYRDVWPLLTFTHSPEDDAVGGLLWIQVGLLGFAAVVIPAVTPRAYVTLDPEVKKRPSVTLNVIV